MARAVALAVPIALVALAACKVDVEGAPCATPGQTADCPSGQACGVDEKCSERATQCLEASQRCVVGQQRCTADAKRSETCTAADPCGAWESLPADLSCGASELVCAMAGQAPRCECAPFAGPEFAADPAAGSLAGAAPFPTGAASPEVCRFKSLGDALARAAALGTAATVQAYGTGDVAFGAATNDGGAIGIPADVTVLGAAGASATILSAVAPTAGAIVTLEGVLRGFHVQAASGDGIAVATACGASGIPALTDVSVDGGGTATAGVDASGACGATLTRVTVANVAGPALSVHADPAAQVTVYGGALRSSRVGAQITGGKVTLGAEGDPAGSVEIAGHANEGVVLTTGAAVVAQLHGALVHGNGGTGIAVDRLSAGSAVTVTSCDVYANGTATPRLYGPGTQRAVGGMLVRQAMLPFVFSGNRLYANASDQLAFESSGTGWPVGAPSCGAASNLFGCVAPANFAVAVTTGSVDAQNAVWLESPPQTSGNVTSTPYCGLGAPPTPACPAP